MRIVFLASIVLSFACSKTAVVEKVVSDSAVVSDSVAVDIAVNATLDVTETAD